MKENEETKERLSSILKLIENHFEGKLPAYIVIDNLEKLLDSLNGLDEEWEQNFRTIWLDAEIAYALSLDEGRTELSNEESEIIKKALKELQILTKNKKDDIKN